MRSLKTSKLIQKDIYFFLKQKADSFKKGLRSAFYEKRNYSRKMIIMGIISKMNCRVRRTLSILMIVLTVCSFMLSGCRNSGANKKVEAILSANDMVVDDNPCIDSDNTDIKVYEVTNIKLEKGSTADPFSFSFYEEKLLWKGIAGSEKAAIVFERSEHGEENEKCSVRKVEEEYVSISAFSSYDNDDIFAVVCEVDSFENKSYYVAKEIEGELKYLFDIGETLSRNGDDTSPLDMESGIDGEIVTLTNKTVYVFDEDGNLNYSCGADADEIFLDLQKCSDGKIYLRGTSATGVGFVRRLDTSKHTLGISFENVPADILGIGYTNFIGCFAFYDKEALYTYDINANKKTKLLDWNNAELEGSEVYAVSALRKGIYTITGDYTGENKLFYITESDEETDRKNISIATFIKNASLNNAVNEYNSIQSDYRIKVKEYYSPNADDTVEEIGDKFSRMMIDCLGENKPDIIDLNFIYTFSSYSASATELISHGYVEDLTDYINKSDSVNIEDYDMKLLKLFMKNDEIAALPHDFVIETLAVNSDEFGSAHGWTTDEFIDYYNTHSESELMPGIDRDTLMKYLVLYNIEGFVDYDTGICNFGKDDFRKIMEFIKDFPEKNNNFNPLRAGVGIKEAHIISLWYKQYSDFTMFRDKTNYIGFPTTDGHPFIEISPNPDSSALAISTASAEKDVAWNFIEFYLSKKFFDTNVDFFEFQNRYSQYYGIPANRIQLQELMEGLKKDGGIMGDIPDEYTKEWYEKNSPDEYHRQPFTDEEVEDFYKMLEDSGTLKPQSRLIYRIIEEEAGAYFADAKSIDDTIKVIESRVQLYLDENQ